ncbi:MAG: HAD family phosphatase [Thermodesulfobacteriota bacterium]
MIKAVIFDMDGVMVDSEYLWERAETILLSRRNIEYNDQYRDQIVGLNQNDSGKLLIETFSLNESIEKVISERIDILFELYDNQLKLNTGLINLLEKLKINNFLLAVASSSPKKVVRYVVDKFKLSNYFHAIISGDNAAEGKPHPEIYLKTAQELSTAPKSCVAIEDSINGLISAKEAGMYCIAVPDKRLSQNLFKKADMILCSLDEITISTIKNINNI